MYLFIFVLLFLPFGQYEDPPGDSHTVLYFFNPDCPACQEISPFIDYLKEEYETAIYSYNTRSSVGFRYSIQYKIQVVPTMIIVIESGEERELKRFEGIIQIRDAESLIARLVNKDA